MKKLVLGVTAVVPAAFTVLTGWAAAAGSAQGMRAAGLLASISWAVWTVLAVWPKRQGR